MEINDGLIAYLEDLSYLTLSDDEKRRLKGDLKEILQGMARLDELACPTEAVGSERHAGYANVFRKDEVQPSFDRELILQNAPDRNDTMIVAPKTVS